MPQTLHTPRPCHFPPRRVAQAKQAAMSILIVFFAIPVLAWESMQIDLPSGAKESLWRDALASNVHGRTEVKLRSGRADVVTSNEVYEVDKPTNWKEGMGQVLAYSADSGKKLVLALIAYTQSASNLTAQTLSTLSLADHTCTRHAVRLLILFPSLPEPPHPVRATGSRPLPPLLPQENATLDRPPHRCYTLNHDGL